jgi:hypothetical protein
MGSPVELLGMTGMVLSSPMNFSVSIPPKRSSPLLAWKSF